MNFIGKSKTLLGALWGKHLKDCEAAGKLLHRQCYIDALTSEEEKKCYLKDGWHKKTKTMTIEITVFHVLIDLPLLINLKTTIVKFGWE